MKITETNIINDIDLSNNKLSRQIKYNELCLILARYNIMINDNNIKLSIPEFIEEENKRRNLFDEK